MGCEPGRRLVAVLRQSAKVLLRVKLVVKPAIAPIAMLLVVLWASLPNAAILRPSATE